MSTADKVLMALQAYNLKREGENKYRSNCPWRTGSDSHALTWVIDPDGEHGAWNDFAGGEGGTLYEAAHRLGIEIEPTQKPATNTKRAYSGLDDYAAAHGVSGDVFRSAKWREGVHQDRPCLIYPTHTGERYRFLDGEKPVYISPTGYQACWFGLGKALNMGKGAIVLCNGEASVIVAQHFGVPAAAKTGGEMRLSEPLLEELKQKTGTCDLWLAMDCDDTGQRVAKEIQQQIPEAVIIDLGMSRGGDLADFCALHGAGAFAELRKKLPAPPVPEAVWAHDVAMQAVTAIEADSVMEGYPLYTPFASFHAFEGLAEILYPGKLAVIIAPTAGGKTSFLETWVDHWLKEGIGGVWRGDEWTPLEYHYRRMQRYGGISYNRIAKHELWKMERKRGVPEANRRGIPLSDHELYHYQEVSYGLAEWRGCLQYYSAGKALEDTLMTMTLEIQKRRRAGEIVGFAVFDYVQLFRVNRIKNDNTSNLHEYVLGLVKDWTIENNIVSIVGSQVTKSGSADNRGNQLIDGHQAQFIRMDKANFVVSLNIVYEDDLDNYNPDGTPRRIPTQRAVANIVKNSTGSIGQVNITTDFARLQWLDVGWSIHRVDLGE